MEKWILSSRLIATLLVGFISQTMFVAPLLAADVDIPCVAEPNRMNLDYGDMTVCSLDDLVDTDVFTFQGQAGEEILLRARGLTTGMEPCFSLYDAVGTLVSSSDCATNRYTQNLRQVLPSSGTYTVSLSDASSDEIGDYRILLERLFPRSPTTKALVQGVTHNDTIDPLGEWDFYAFSGSVGDNIIIEARALDTAMEPCFSLYRPDGSLMDSSPCATNRYTQQLSVVLDQRGIHYLHIQDASTDEIGSYDIVLQCIVGPCVGRPVFDYSSGDVAWLPDSNADGSDEIAVLRKKDNALLATIKESVDLRFRKQIWFFSEPWKPIALARIPDYSGNGFSELVVLATNQNTGNSAIRIRDVSSGQELNHVFLFDRLWKVRGLSVVADRNGNGADEIAVLAENAGRALVRIIDPVSEEILVNLPYGK